MQSTDPQHVQVVNSVLCTHIWSPIQPCTYNNDHTANKYHTHVAQSSASRLTVHFVIDYGEIAQLNSGSSNVFTTLITIHIIDYPFAKYIISIVIFLFEERSLNFQLIQIYGSLCDKSCDSTVRLDSGTQRQHV